MWFVDFIHTKDLAVASAHARPAAPGLWKPWKLPTPPPTLEIPPGFPQLPPFPQPLRRRRTRELVHHGNGHYFFSQPRLGVPPISEADQRRSDSPEYVSTRGDGPPSALRPAGLPCGGHLPHAARPLPSPPVAQPQRDRPWHPRPRSLALLDAGLCLRFPVEPLPCATRREFTVWAERSTLGSTPPLAAGPNPA